MSKKSKKILFFGLGGLDVAITIALLVIHIIMLVGVANVKANGDDIAKVGGLVGFLANNMTLYLWAFVVPLFVLLALNIVGLVVYVKKTVKSQEKKVSDLSEEEREALKKELLKELAQQQEENK